VANPTDRALIRVLAGTTYLFFSSAEPERDEALGLKAQVGPTQSELWWVGEL
jgi:hypothetical protein